MAAPDYVPRILIVDDEAAHMRALCDTLRERDYDTVGFVSGDAALAAMGEAKFDLLLTDLMMPGIDGIALVQAARAIDPDIACIVMTGEGSIASAVRAMKVGALDYVTKPLKVSAVLPILARALETRMLRMENVKLERRLREHAIELAALNVDLELARKQADRANQEKSNFLSNMSHELRTPLNAILGFAQILSSEKFPSTLEEKRAFADHIVKSGKHLLALINEVLDLAKVESGTISLSVEAVALSDVLRECRTMIDPLASVRGIGLRFPAPGDAHVLADRTRLKQILINLLSNAIKYNRAQGMVTVNCLPQPGGRVRIAVQDIGAGLDQAQLEAIFQPFNRLGQEASKEEGTGIGLVLTKRLVEAMQGAIGVASLVGVGSTFWIELATCTPVETPRNAGRTGARRGAPAQRPNERKTLLYVEDNPTNLILVTELLRMRSDLDLLPAADGHLGIELARRHLPDVILMDMNLPGIDGIETRRILHDDPSTAHIPIIAITASAMLGETSRGKRAGFFRYLTKPIDLATFTEAIDSALASSTARHDE